MHKAEADTSANFALVWWNSMLLEWNLKTPQSHYNLPYTTNHSQIHEFININNWFLSEFCSFKYIVIILCQSMLHYHSNRTLLRYHHHVSTVAIYLLLLLACSYAYTLAVSLNFIKFRSFIFITSIFPLYVIVLIIWVFHSCGTVHFHHLIHQLQLLQGL